MRGTPAPLSDGEIAIASQDGTEFASRSLDRRIAALAAGQLGVVSLAQLTGLGLSPSGVRSRVGRGRLTTVWRGVYALGTPLVHGARELAATLVSGPGAALSFRSAGGLTGIRPYSGRVIDITIPTSRRSRPGIRFHTVGLAPADRTVTRGIPITSTARTLLDLAGGLGADDLARCIDRAERLRLFDLAAVRELLGRSAGQRGVRRLREVLALELEPTSNELEAAMLRICRRAGLPTPSVNHWLNLPDGRGVRLDFLWAELGLAIETDGFATHGTRLGFDRDRARDRRLAAQADIETFRFTWREVMLEPATVADELRGLVARAERRIPSPHGTEFASRGRVAAGYGPNGPPGAEAASDR